MTMIYSEQKVSEEVAQEMARRCEWDLWTVVSVSVPCQCNGAGCECREYRQHVHVDLGLPKAIAIAVRCMAATCNNMNMELVEIRPSNSEEIKAWEDNHG